MDSLGGVKRQLTLFETNDIASRQRKSARSSYSEIPCSSTAGEEICLHNSAALASDNGNSDRLVGILSS